MKKSVTTTCPLVNARRVRRTLELYRMRHFIYMLFYKHFTALMSRLPTHQRKNIDTAIALRVIERESDTVTEKQGGSCVTIDLNCRQQTVSCVRTHDTYVPGGHRSNFIHSVNQIHRGRTALKTIRTRYRGYRDVFPVHKNRRLNIRTYGTL